MGKRFLLDLNAIELQEFVKTYRQPLYRARQLLEWVYAKRATSFDELTNLPKAWREQLQRSVILNPFRASDIFLSHPLFRCL